MSAVDWDDFMAHHSEPCGILMGEVYVPVNGWRSVRLHLEVAERMGFEPGQVVFGPASGGLEVTE